MKHLLALLFAVGLSMHAPAQTPPPLANGVELIPGQERTSLDRTNGRLSTSVSVRLRNGGVQTWLPPLHVVVTFAAQNSADLTSLATTGLLGGLNQAPYQTFYADLSASAPAGLAPGQEITFPFSFVRPSTARITYALAARGFLPTSEALPLLPSGISVVFGEERSALNRANDRLTSTVTATLQNTGDRPVDPPLHAVVTFTPRNGGTLSELSASGVLGGIGQAPYQTYFMDLTPAIGAGLAAGASTSFTFNFERPSRARVSYAVAAHGRRNQDPAVQLGGPYSGQQGVPVAFDASASTDPDNEPLSFAWDFGDGSASTAAAPAHPFAAPGLYTVTVIASDPRGGRASRQAEVPVYPQGEFAVARTRTLDGNGHPLGGVAIAQAGPDGACALSSDSDTGFASLGGAPGDHLWAFSRPGYLTVHRRTTLSQGQIRVLAFPWLAELNPVRTTLSVLTPSSVVSPSGKVTLACPPEAFGQVASVALTDLHGQALPLPLPPGWSPLAAFHADLPVEASTNLTASLSLPVPLLPGQPAAWIRLDEAPPAWVVEATIAGAGSNQIQANVRKPGGYALVVPDGLGAGDPPPAQPGQPLTGCDAPVISPDVSASGNVDPATAVASRDAARVTATATVVFTNGTQVLRSGAWFLSEVSETYELNDGRALKTPDYDATFYAYRHPGGAASPLATARFPLRPRVLFGPEELTEAVIRVDVQALNQTGGGIVTADGGLLSLSGIQVAVPAGAVSGPSAAEIHGISTNGLARFLGVSVAERAFALNLPPLAGGSALGFSITQHLAPDAHFVLARCIGNDAESGLQPVLRLRSDAQGVVTASEPASGPRLPGLTGSGQYVLVRVAAAEALVTGQVTNSGGLNLASATVRAEGEPWLSLTPAGGTFATLATPGARDITATDPANGDQGTAVASLANSAAHAHVLIQTAATGPRIVSTSPTNDAVKVLSATPVVVRFSEPLDPASFTPDSLTLTNPLGVRILGSLALNLAGTEATFLPTNPLEHAARYTAELAATLRDRQGLVLEGSRSFAFSVIPFFERPVGAQLVIYEPGATNVPAVVLAQLVGYEGGPGSSLVIAHGSPGVADPEVPVILVNEATGATATVLSKPDGSFANFIDAQPDDFIRAVYFNANGTRVEVPATRQLYDDGRVGLYRQGGILEAESDGGPIQVQIEPAAIPSRTVFRLKSFSVQDLMAATGGIAPAGEALALPGLTLEVTEGEPPKSGTEISIPFDPSTISIPPDVDPEKLAFALTRPMEVEGTVVYVTADKMRYKDGKLFTNTCPFSGLDQIMGAQNVVSTVENFVPLSPLASMTLNIAVQAVPVMVGQYLENRGTISGTSMGGQVVQLPIASIDAISALQLSALSRIGLSVLPRVGKALFSAVDIVNLDNLVEVGAVRRSGIPVPGALVGVYPAGFVPKGRLTPGLVCAVSDENGCYNLVVPTPLDAEIFATHPKLGMSTIAPGLDLLNLSASLTVEAPYILRNIFFAIPKRDPSGIKQIFSSHTPRYPALNEPATITVDVFRLPADNGSITVTNAPPAVHTLVLGQAATLSDITVSNSTSCVEISPGHFRACFSVTAQKALEARIQFGVSLVSTNSGSAVRPPIAFTHGLAFGFNPVSIAGQLKAADTNDVQRPKIVGTFPLPGESIRLGEPVRVRFSEPINRSILSLTGAVTTGVPPDPLLELSADQQTLSVTLVKSPVSSGNVSLTFSQNIEDLIGNDLGTNVVFSYVYSSPEISDLSPHVAAGGGSAMLGNVAYVLEQSGSGAIKIFDISQSGSSYGLVKEIPFLGGYPRSVCVIPNWAYVPGLNMADGGGTPAELPAVTNSLLAVAGGLLSVGLDSLGNPEFQGQFLQLYDLSDPLNPKQLTGTRLTLRPAAVPKLLWNPPNLYYLENGADLHLVGRIDLQEMLIGLSVPPNRVTEIFRHGFRGNDLNGDGDYVDPAEIRPWPRLQAVRDFFGLKDVYIAPIKPAQRVEDFAVADGAVAIVRSSSGSTATNSPSVAEFRLLTDRSGQELHVSEGAYSFTSTGEAGGRIRPARVALVTDVLMTDTNGVETTHDLAFVSLSPDSDGKDRLVVLDISNPLLPIPLLQTIDFAAAYAGSGIGAGLGKLRSAQLRPDGLLALSTTEELIIIDPSRLLLPGPQTGQPSAGSGFHPAVLSILPGGGSSNFSIGENDFGSRLLSLGARTDLLIQPPRIDFVQFPAAPALVEPSLIPAQSASAIAEDVAAMRFTKNLRPARLRSVAGVPSAVDAKSPLAFYHVLVRGMGGTENQIPILLESVNTAGQPLPNQGPGYPPVRAAGTESLAGAGLTARDGYDETIRSVKAFRMSDDVTSPYFSYFLSEPFAMVREKLPKAEDNAPPVLNPPVLLWSDAGIRASLDAETAGPLGLYAAIGDGDGYRLKVSALGGTIAGGYVPGALAPPVGGELAVPGTFGAINASNGEFRHRTVDLELPSRRMPIVIQRTATSQALSHSAFGRGWDFNYNQRIIYLTPELVPRGQREPVVQGSSTNQTTVAESKDIILNDGEGNAILFSNQGRNAPPGVDNDPLVSELGWLGAGGEFYLPGNNVRGVFDILYRFPSGEAARLTPDGTRFYYQSDGRLSRIVDRHPANVHELEYNTKGELIRIVDRAAGDRFVRFGYYRKSGETTTTPDKTVASGGGGAGLICSIEDSAGRQVDFEYNAMGMLVKRLGVRVSGANEGFNGRPTTTYQIDSTRHVYVGIIAGSGAHGGQGAGTALISSKVEDNNHGEAKTTSTTGAGGNTTIAGAGGQGAGGGNGGNATTADHADSSSTKMEFDDNGYPAKVTLGGAPAEGSAPVTPAVFETTHNAQGLPHIVTAPEGNATLYTYASGDQIPYRSRGNVVAVTLDPGPRGGGTLRSGTQYDLRYNQPSGVQTTFNGDTYTITLGQDGRETEKIVYPRAGTAEFAYNKYGQLTNETTVEGVKIAHTYSGDSGYLEKTTRGTAPDALDTTYAYDSSIAGSLGAPTTITPPSGEPYSVVYDALLRPLSTTRGAQAEKTGYDENGNIIFLSRALGGGSDYIERRKYSQINFLEEVKVAAVETGADSKELITSFTPDVLNRVKSITLPGGEVRTFTYNHLGHVTKMALAGGAYSENFTRDLHGNLLSFKKGSTLVNAYAYDGHDRTVSATDVVSGTASNTTSLAYFGHGALKSRKVEGTVGGVVLEMVVDNVDELGRPLKITAKGQAVQSASTTFDYQQEGGKKTVVTGPRETTSRTRDNAGRPSASSDSLRTVTVTTDRNGNPTRISSAEAGTTYAVDMVYNALDQVTKTSDSVGTLSEVTSLRLDGRPLTLKDGRGNVTTSTYSKLGEQLQLARPLGIQFNYQYDKNRQPAFVGDMDDKGHRFAYSATLRREKTTLRNGSETLFNDPNDLNLPEDIQIPGGGITASYDHQGRPTSLLTTYTGEAYTFENATYDALGRLRSANYGKEGEFSLSMTYDKLGPLTSCTYNEVGGAYTVAAGIRNDGARTSLTYPSGVVVTETRHASGRLDKIDIDGGVIWEATAYASAGEPSTLKRGTNIIETCTYDDRRRLMSRKWERVSAGPGRLLEEMRVVYDAVDNVVARQFLAGGGRADLFEYDAANRLTRAEYGARPVITGGVRTRDAGLGGGQGLESGLYARTYAYDTAQGGTGSLDLLLGGTLVNPSALPLQLSANHPLAVAHFASTIADHDDFLFARTVDGFDRGVPDALGNTARSQLLVRPVSGPPVLVGADLTYNGRSNLVKVDRDDGVVIEYKYRPDNLLHHRTVTGGAHAGETKLVWHEGRLLEEYRVVSGQTGTTNLLARYYYADGDSPVAADLRQADGSLLRVHYFCDQVMSVVAVANQAGEVVERVRYDAWGQPVYSPRDDLPPRVAEIRVLNGDVLVVTSEPVLPLLNDSFPSGLVTAFSGDPSSALALMANNQNVTVTVTFEEDLPGFPFGSVFRIAPDSPLSGSVTLTVRAERLQDAYGNRMPAASIPFSSNAPLTPGSVAVGTTLRASPHSEIGNAMAFQGQPFSADSGLVYMRARFFDPTNGLFLQQDPVGYSDGVNLYAAFMHCPTGLRDPTGSSVDIAKLIQEVVSGTGEASTAATRAAKLPSENLTVTKLAAELAASHSASQPKAVIPTIYRGLHMDDPSSLIKQTSRGVHETPASFSGGHLGQLNEAEAVGRSVDQRIMDSLISGKNEGDAVLEDFTLAELILGTRREQRAMSHIGGTDAAISTTPNKDFAAEWAVRLMKKGETPYVLEMRGVKTPAVSGVIGPSGSRRAINPNEGDEHVFTEPIRFETGVIYRVDPSTRKMTQIYPVIPGSNHGPP